MGSIVAICLIAGFGAAALAKARGLFRGGDA